MTDAKKITYLDGPRLHRALVAGIRQVISRQDYLNKINVFPVPDRDTGTNMALTLNAIIEATYTFEKPPIHKLLETVADASLNGARGNSGAIWAQFFQGLSEGATTVNKKMTTKNFVAAVATGVNYAHKALSEPKEGTILTVIRDFSNEITQLQLSSDDHDFLSLLHAGIQRAETSLQHTSVQLKELKKANVVDAGAQGFVDFLNGIYEFIQSGSIKDLLESDDMPIPQETIEEDLRQAVDERYRFCTECLVIGTDINHDELREQLDELGNSLIVAGSSKKTKIHIHANDPAQVFDIARQYGSVTGEKADDMIHQQKSFNHRDTRVAILTDSAADFPEGMITDLDIHVVPLQINFKDQTFLDKVSMTSREFYAYIESTGIHPKTSQPSFGDFHRQYQYLNSHYESIIAIHIPRSISGTIVASETASKKFPNDTISILDSKSVTTGMGLIVRHAAEAAKLGYSHQEILDEIAAVLPNTKAYAALPDLNYAVKGGRIPSKKKIMADLLRITPVVTFDEAGKISTGGILPGRKHTGKRLAKLIRRKFDSGKTYRFAVVHCNNAVEAKSLESHLKEYFPHIESISMVDCGAALGAHVGPGPVGLGIQEYRPLTPKT